MSAHCRAALLCAYLLGCTAAPALAQETNNSDESAETTSSEPSLATLDAGQASHEEASPSESSDSAGSGTLPEVVVTQPRRTTEAPQPAARSSRTTSATRSATPGYRPTSTYTPEASVMAAPQGPSFAETTAISRPAAIASSVPNVSDEWQVTSDTASMMSRLPGSAVYSAGGISGLPVLNGLAADRLNSQIDGMNLIAACANQMNPPLSYIAPSQVSSINVYQNLVPVSVGSDSIGGTILVEQAPPVFAAAGQGVITSAEIGGYYRSNGDAFGGNAAASAAVQNFGISYTGAYEKSGNYRAGGDFKDAGPAFMSVPNRPVRAPWLAADEVGSSAYEAQNHNIGVAARNENHLLQFDLGIQQIPFQNYPNQRMDMTENESILGNLRYTGDFDWGVLEAQVYHQQVRHEMDFGDDKQFFYQNMMTGIVAPGMPMNTKAEDTGVKIKASFDVSERDTLRIGGEYQDFDYSDLWPPSPRNLPPMTMAMMAPDTFYSINNGQRDRYDVFAEWEARWSPQWTTELGVRSDTVVMNTGRVQGYNAMYDAPPLFPATTFNEADRKRTDQNWNVTAEAIYTPDETKTFSFGYSKKSRSPNLYERYAWSNVTMAMEMIGWFGDGNFYIGNLDLDPEDAHTFSATLDWHDAEGKNVFAVTPYYTYVANYIDVRRCPTTVCGASQAVIDSLTATEGFVYLQFINQDAHLYGVNVAGHMVLAEYTPFGTFSARGIVSYVDGINDVTDDNLYHMMPINGTVAIEHSLGRWSNTIEAEMVGAKTEVSQVRNEVETGAYTLWNIRSSYTWNNFRVDVGVENLFDQFYDLPLGGLYLGQGATMAPNGIPWGIALPGPGRSFYVAANMKF